MDGCEETKLGWALEVPGEAREIHAATMVKEPRASPAFSTLSEASREAHLWGPITPRKGTEVSRARFLCSHEKPLGIFWEWGGGIKITKHPLCASLLS